MSQFSGMWSRWPVVKTTIDSVTGCGWPFRARQFGYAGEPSQQFRERSRTHSTMCFQLSGYRDLFSCFIGISFSKRNTVSYDLLHCRLVPFRISVLSTFGQCRCRGACDRYIDSAVCFFSGSTPGYSLRSKFYRECGLSGLFETSGGKSLVSDCSLKLYPI